MVAGVGLAVALLLATPVAEAGMNEPNGGARPGRFITEFPITAGAGAGATFATAGPDGNVWFTEFLGDRIGRITPTGAVIESPLPVAGSRPEGITSGSDGSLWFTESARNRIGRITPAGVITEFPLPTPGSNPHRIVAGRDGHLWFTERAVDRIGRSSTTGKITEYQLASGRLPLEITAARDGSLWFTDRAANCVGRITVAGRITEFAVPTPDSDPLGITAGPDGTIWFVEGKGDRIARLNPQRRDGSPCQTGAPAPTCGPSSPVTCAARAWHRPEGRGALEFRSRLNRKVAQMAQGGGEQGQRRHGEQDGQCPHGGADPEGRCQRSCRGRAERYRAGDNEPRGRRDPAEEMRRNVVPAEGDGDDARHRGACHDYEGSGCEQGEPPAGATGWQ